MLEGDWGEGIWIFLTAVFLVLFFLFYRHPKAMLKAKEILVGVLGLICIGFYFEPQQSRKVKNGRRRPHNGER